jgi:hypothetical protein
MVKAKQGRMTSNTKGRKKDNPPRPQRICERAKEREQKKTTKSNEIDTTTLADDDPTPTLREKVRGFLALMGDDSSEEGEDNRNQTPRKGDDKKRQRFAEETEVIELGEDGNPESSMEGPPEPVRLLRQMETDESLFNKEVTIADVLGVGPNETVTLPQPLVIAKDCRYTCQVKVQPSDNPVQHIADKFLYMVKWLKNKIGKDLAIATWDDLDEKQVVYLRTSQLPKPTETSAWIAIWGTWINIKPQQEGTAYLKIRFVTQAPDTLTRRLMNIGELREEITAATEITIGRSPIPCQAVQVACSGWLFGSNRHMNGENLLQEIAKLANIPPHVRMGISWRTIKLENGKTPPWVDNVQPASALHIDIDWFHGPVYNPLIANIFKKHGNVKPLGLNLRLIPCFSSDEGKNSTTDRKMAANKMRDKQEFLITQHITVIKTPYILNLDKPTKPNGTMTLWRYLKNLHPQGLVAARLVLSVDQAWKEGSRETNIVTTKEYASQVQDALRDMIPECVHKFGLGMKGWFTTEGLQAFQGVNWDPKQNKSVSDRDVEAMRIVSKDYFGMGEAWRTTKAGKKDHLGDRQQQQHRIQRQPSRTQRRNSQRSRPF